MYKTVIPPITNICKTKPSIMKTLTQKPKPQQQNSFEDLEDETFGKMLWNPAMLNRAIPKETNRVKKMRSR